MFLNAVLKVLLKGCGIGRHELLHGGPRESEAAATAEAAALVTEVAPTAWDANGQGLRRVKRRERHVSVLHVPQFQCTFSFTYISCEIYTYIYCIMYMYMIVYLYYVLSQFSSSFT